MKTEQPAAVERSHEYVGATTSLETDIPEEPQEVEQGVEPEPQGASPHRPKYNFSPRRKAAPEESMETQAAPEAKQEQWIIRHLQESEDIYVLPEIEHGTESREADD
jgi:hypothetical protein